MAVKPIPFGKMAYELSSRPVSVQRCLNFYPEVIPEGEGKSRIVLYGTPGLEKKLTLGTSIVYGLHEMDGTLYAVTATRLYRISSGWIATELGTVNITGHCSMADNGTQLVFVDGTNGYVWDESSDTLSDLSTVGNWSAANTATFQDQYIIFNKTGTGQFFLSNLADATTYNALDFATAEGAPDDTIAVISDHRELWLFGKRTIEIWQNTGAADFPFERVAGAFIERGCGAALSVAKEDNTVFWLGDDLVVYRAADYTPQRISQDAIDYQISTYTTTSDAFAYTYTEQGHKFYVLTFPTEGATWVYDISNGLWHERSYFIAATGKHTRHRSNAYAKAYGKHVVGDFETGGIYVLSEDVYTDDSDTIQRIVASPPLYAGRSWVRHSKVEIEFESGVGLTGGDDPQARIRYSDDGGRTWSNERWRGIGNLGQYTARARWQRLGRALQRTYELTVSDPVKWVVIGAFGDLYVG